MPGAACANRGSSNPPGVTLRGTAALGLVTEKPAVRKCCASLAGAAERVYLKGNVSGWTPLLKHHLCMAVRRKCCILPGKLVVLECLNPLRDAAAGYQCVPNAIGALHGHILFRCSRIFYLCGHLATNGQV